MLHLGTKPMKMIVQSLVQVCSYPCATNITTVHSTFKQHQYKHCPETVCVCVRVYTHKYNICTYIYISRMAVLVFGTERQVNSSKTRLLYCVCIYIYTYKDTHKNAHQIYQNKQSQKRYVDSTQQLMSNYVQVFTVQISFLPDNFNIATFL